METSFAFAINPSAGWHPVTSDPEEVEAARRAGEASLREFPYYVERYGERGRFFAASDGAWLVNLAAGGGEYVERQVLWLGTVLASRGMPRWLLERHLELLHDELGRARPRDAGRYRPLLDAAALLRGLRERRIPPAVFRGLALEFAARVGPEWSRRLPGMGGILAAAVADEADGIANAVASVEPWATDPTVFPPIWVAAVRATLAEARESARPPS
ncbi:MAG TPA: hypothetical protein VF263_08860 [Longimicrobiaceae bacterium]